MNHIILYDHEFQLVICTVCKMRLPNGRVLRHVSEEHKETWKARREELKTFVGGLFLFSPAELETPTEKHERVEGIEVKDGWICGWRGCTVSGMHKKWVQEHSRKQHGIDAVGG